MGLLNKILGNASQASTEQLTTGYDRDEYKEYKVVLLKLRFEKQ